MDLYTNEELFQGIKNRDEDILDYIIKRFKPGIKVMIKRMNGNIQDLDDIFHDGLLAIFEKVEKGTLQPDANLQNLLYVICSNKKKDKIRKKNAADNYYSNEIRKFEIADYSDDSEMPQYRKAMRESIKQLEEVCRKIITMLLMDYTPKEIAGFLDYSYDYIRRKSPECKNDLMKRARAYNETNFE